MDWLKLSLNHLPAAGVATFLALFPLVNPFGGISLFASLTSGYQRLERRGAAMRITVYVIGILVTFMFFGRFVMNFFGISLPVLKISGGLIVAHTAWMMVTGESRITSAESADASHKQDFTFSPMAMPVLAGPGSMGVVMGLAAHTSSPLAYLGMVLGILGVGLSTLAVLLLSGPLDKHLGPVAMGAINRIFGFLILSVAGQLIWNGLQEFPFR